MQRLNLARNISVEDNGDILSDLSRPTVKFDDVIGAEDAKTTMKDFLRYLKNPKQYTESGARPPRGILLYGPPGTGKTLLAKALAGESNVAFIQKNSTEFLTKYVGGGPKSVRDMFKQARKYAPAIIFIDECDVFATKRTGSEIGRSGEEVLTAFLSELDGFVFDAKKPVLVVVATNYQISGNGPTVLDPAFVRRFDRKICIELPNTEERERFIKYYLNKHSIKTIDDETVKNIASRTYGYSPANLEMVIELAIRNAGGNDVTPKILNDSLDEEASGKVNKFSEESVKRTSYHEAGHTVIHWLCGKKPTFVTNVSRGGYGGYMLTEVDDSEATSRKQDLLDDICCSLGGRAAEIVVYGEESGLTTGASGDLAQATRVAKTIISNYGMESGILAAFNPHEFGPSIDEMIFKRVNEILISEFERACKMLTDNRDLLEKVTSKLIEKNSLTKAEIEELLG